MAETATLAPTLTLTGESETKYEFKVYDFGASFKEGIAAVYAVTKATKSTKKKGSHTHETLYIGETEDIKERLKDHHKKKCFTDNSANRICIHKESGSKKRLDIEADLIESYDPICNGQTQD